MVFIWGPFIRQKKGVRGKTPKERKEEVYSLVFFSVVCWFEDGLYFQ